MATNKYIGSRYVPKYFGTWDSSKNYEALSIVSDAQGEYTYTSKRPVPAGTLLSNVEYWAPSGRLSESMEIGVISHVDSTKADNATIAANKLNITFASDYTMNDSTKVSLNLNTTVQSGTYGINPSLCTNVPDDLKLSADTAQLFVYVVGANTYTQTLLAPKAAGYYVRISTNDQWSEWVSVGGTAVTYATKANAGLVQLGDGLKSENVTGLTSIDHDATLDMTASNKLTVAVGEHMETDSSGRIDPMLANTAQAGIVQVGGGISVSNGTISVPNATTSSKGIVQIGNGINVTNGVVSVPKATPSQAGIVQVGNGISVNDGVISTITDWEELECTNKINIYNSWVFYSKSLNIIYAYIVYRTPQTKTIGYDSDIECSYEINGYSLKNTIIALGGSTKHNITYNAGAGFGCFSASESNNKILIKLQWLNTLYQGEYNTACAFVLKCN